MKRLALLIMLLNTVAPAAPMLEAVDIEGTWLNGDGDGLVEIRLTDAGLSGVIRGSATTGTDRPDHDHLNPDPELRERPLVGLQIFDGFEYDGHAAWSGGTIYDPNSGKTWQCRLQLVDRDTLRVRGYVGIALLGRTETWKRQD